MLDNFGSADRGIALVLTAFGYGILGEQRYRYQMTVEVQTPSGVES
ncbi:hypothetical protein M527_23620 [Sphingobium indicum IP26]|nr:hypothetical protein M527_23620 [Sphingobium indicum IP26]